MKQLIDREKNTGKKASDLATDKKRIAAIAAVSAFTRELCEQLN
jgi:hypothetical protein